MQQLIKTLQYNGKPIEFEIINGQVFANATAMCQAFGKKPADWLRLATTQRYIDALKAKWENLTSVETRQGGADKGSTLKVSTKTVYRRIEGRELKTVLLSGKSYGIRKSEIEKYLTRK